MEFAREHFFGLLLTAIFVTLLTCLLIGMWHPKMCDPGTMTWLQQKTGEVLAAILAISVGSRAAGGGK